MLLYWHRSSLNMPVTGMQAGLFTSSRHRAAGAGLGATVLSAMEGVELEELEALPPGC